MATVKAEETTMVSKFGKSEKQTVEGTEYTFQFPGVRAVESMLDDAKRGGSFSNVTYNEAIMEHVIVSPKTDWDYWNEHDGYREVMQLADNFLGSLL